ncbi:unnamed protein product [Chrysoparadoxa australica]
MEESMEEAGESVALGASNAEVEAGEVNDGASSGSASAATGGDYYDEGDGGGGLSGGITGHVNAAQEPGRSSEEAAAVLEHEVQEKEEDKANVGQGLPVAGITPEPGSREEGTSIAGHMRVLQEPGGSSQGVASLLQEYDAAGIEPKAGAGAAGGIRTMHTAGGSSEGVALSLQYRTSEVKEQVTAAVEQQVVLAPAGEAVSNDAVEEEVLHTGSDAGVEGERNLALLEDSLPPAPEAATASLHEEGLCPLEESLCSAVEYSSMQHMPQGGLDLPLELILHLCIERPLLDQCDAIDRVSLTYFCQGANLQDHLRALQELFLCCHTSFLYDFTRRLLEGISITASTQDQRWSLSHGQDSCVVDWTHLPNVEASFMDAAHESGLDQAAYFKHFSYIVEGETDRATALNPADTEALMFLQPLYKVSWPLGVIITTPVCQMYSSLHRTLFRHQLAMHRLREVWCCLRGGCAGAPRGVHLFRHQLQHVGDCIQAHFTHQCEIGWAGIQEAFCSAWEPGSAIRDIVALEHVYRSAVAAMHHNCFLGSDALSKSLLCQVHEFYNVVCAMSASSSAGSFHGWEEQRGRLERIVGELVHALASAIEGDGDSGGSESEHLLCLAGSLQTAWDS